MKTKLSAFAAFKSANKNRNPPKRKSRFPSNDESSSSSPVSPAPIRQIDQNSAPASSLLHLPRKMKSNLKKKMRQTYSSSLDPKVLSSSLAQTSSQLHDEQITDESALPLSKTIASDCWKSKRTNSKRKKRRNAQVLCENHTAGDSVFNLDSQDNGVPLKAACNAESRKVTSPPAECVLRAASQSNGITSVNRRPSSLVNGPLMLPVAGSNSYMFDSRIEGEMCLEWLIHPYDLQEFFGEIWEKKPLLLKRQNANYYRGLFSTSQLDFILREKNLWFGKNVDVTTYINGVRETHNPPGRAHASTVWDYYQNGCSVRLLNPQTFARSIWKLNSTLQEAFGSFVGANVYLTPAGSQGFAPHFDDIEAFILQVEGRKKWKLYNPSREEDVLPRTSSANLREEDLGDPVLEAELSAGDLLYFPRGVIHQASTPADTHSLHVTVSACQRNTWGDLLEKLVPRMLQLAIEKDVAFRKALPRDYMRYMGIANNELSTSNRLDFEAKTRQLLASMVNWLPLDAAVDQMAKGFIHDALPPLLTKSEKSRTIVGSGERWTKRGVVGSVELDPDTRVKLLRSNLIRLVLEDDGVNLYHSIDNSREYHAEEIQCIPISAECAPAVEYLLHEYPNFASIESLPLEKLETKMEVATMLYDNGLLVTEEPMDPMESAEENE